MGNSKHQLLWNENSAYRVCGSQSIIWFLAFLEFSRSDRLFSVHSGFHMLYEVVCERHHLLFFYFAFSCRALLYYFLEQKQFFFFRGWIQQPSFTQSFTTLKNRLVYWRGHWVGSSLTKRESPSESEKCKHVEFGDILMIYTCLSFY